MTEMTRRHSGGDNSGMMFSSTKHFAWLSIAAAFITILLKALAWWLTGSIGVIASQSVDMTELLKKLGVKVETITAGKNKNMLNINSPLTDEQRAIMQSIADEAYEQFTAIVAKSRGMKIGEVKKLADGRIYTASQAKKNGLVDEIGTWEDALSSLRKEIGDNESVVTTYRYEKKDSLLEMLSEAASKAGKADALIPDAIRRELMLGISYPAYIYRK